MTKIDIAPSQGGVLIPATLFGVTVMEASAPSVIDQVSAVDKFPGRVPCAQCTRHKAGTPGSDCQEERLRILFGGLVDLVIGW